MMNMRLVLNIGTVFEKSVPASVLQRGSWTDCQEVRREKMADLAMIVLCPKTVGHYAYMKIVMTVC